MLSGRSTVLCAYAENAGRVVGQCCRRLAITQSGNEKLVHGTEVLPPTAKVGSWPGLRPCGQVSEYQLVVGALKRKAAELHAP
eukprot:3162666-Amphidinium_carterae.1